MFNNSGAYFKMKSLLQIFPIHQNMSLHTPLKTYVALSPLNVHFPMAVV